MNDMYPMRDYRDDYRDDYRRDYRGNYRDDYREYDRRGGRRNYRNYREEDYLQQLEECVEEGMHKYRNYEDLAEMADNPQEKNMIMKVAQTEKQN